MPKTVALITMGCARNDVDSEELAGRLAADGWKLVDDAAKAEVAVINTCGFIESAKQDSINTLLEAHALKGNGVTKAVVAVGCMAERYGEELANALPEADGILSFDDYQDISARLGDILSGHKPTPHVPQDRRKLLPIAPADRIRTSDFARKRLTNDPWAPLKIASGCDRRCSFCAIPQFRGAFVSRHPLEVIEEAKWLAENGVSELFLVSENTTSYGKDLGDLRAMEKLLPELSKIDGVKRIRLSYLQPAEMRPTLLQAMIENEKVAPYFAALVIFAARKIFGPKGVKVQPHSLRRAFQYIILYGLVTVVGIGLSGLVSHLLEGDKVVVTDKVALALELSFTLVGIPIIIFLGLWSHRQLKKDPTEKLSSGFQFYLYATSITSLLFTMVAFIDLLRWAVGDAAFHPISVGIVTGKQIGRTHV